MNSSKYLRKYSKSLEQSKIWNTFFLSIIIYPSNKCHKSSNVCENFSNLFDVISNKPSWFTSNIIFMNAIVETRTLKTKNFFYLACVVLSKLVLMASIRIGFTF